ncbi:MAG: glycosyltransferase [Thermoguttaceae bacterium]|nr:glycosyltransferase [Thermoguttaceae bacterium]
MTVSISVIMPVYNSERYLSIAIESILAQTFKNFEFIIVNDGSTDSSLEIIQNYQAKDSRIRIIDQPNQGVTKSLNNAINLAQGKYIARMDADDISMPDRLAKQFQYLEAHPEIAVCGSGALIIDEDGDVIRIDRVVCTHENIEKRHLSGKCSMKHPSVIIRADVLRKVNGYNEELPYAQDFDLWLRIGEIGKLENLREPLIKYRRCRDSISSRKKREQWEAACKAIDDASIRRGIKLPYPPFKASSHHAFFKPRLYLKSTWYYIKTGSFQKALKQFVKLVKSCFK